MDKMCFGCTNCLEFCVSRWREFVARALLCKSKNYFALRGKASRPRRDKFAPAGGNLNLGGSELNLGGKKLKLEGKKLNLGGEKLKHGGKKLNPGGKKLNL